MENKNSENPEDYQRPMFMSTDPLVAQAQLEPRHASVEGIEAPEASIVKPMVINDPNNHRRLIFIFVFGIILLLTVGALLFYYFQHKSKYSPVLNNAFEMTKFSTQSLNPEASLAPYTVNGGGFSYKALFYNDSKVVNMNNYSQAPIAIQRPGEFLTNSDTLFIKKVDDKNPASCLTTASANAQSFEIQHRLGIGNACSAKVNSYTTYQYKIGFNGKIYEIVVIGASKPTISKESVRQIFESVEILP